MFKTPCDTETCQMMCPGAAKDNFLRYNEVNVMTKLYKKYRICMILLHLEDLQ